MHPIVLSRILCLILLVNYSAYSQDNIPDVKPLSPNAAAMFKVLERPPGTYTGTVPVQFPLCSVSSGHLSASLSLSYNGTGGIRVEETASCVGLGFSLDDGGGSIVQTVRGQPDDMTYGMLNNPTKPSNFDCYDMNGDVYGAYYAPYQVDFEPDIFMYNFNGQSGKFFLKEDGTVVMMQKTNFKIAYLINSNGIYQWVITDDKGIRYIFDNKQWSDYTYTDMQSSTTSYGPSSASWYLTSMEDGAVSKYIYFTHQASGDLFTTLSGGRLILPPTTGCNQFDLSTQNNVVQTGASELIVSKITANSGFILINTSGGRLDSYGRRVDSIRLFTPDSQLVKKYKFNYAYFSVGSNMWEKRLYLKDFSEFGSSGNDSITHKFEYHTDYNLPSRLSNNTDSWGFYNGYINSDIFPNYVFINGPTQYRRTNLGKKNAKFEYAKAGTLKKIKYPTGGYREFIYEGNTALVPFSPNLYHPDETNSATRSFNHSESEWNSNYGFTVPFFTKYFVVNSNDGGTDFRYNLTVPYNCDIQIKIYKTTSPNQSTGGTLVLNTTVASNLNFGNTLANGNYRMEFYREIACWVSGLFASWSECTLSLGTVQSPHYQFGSFNENNKNVGGLRIKEIRDYDPVSNKTNKTEYKYKIYSGDSTLTSGLLITQPKYIAGQQPSGVGCYVNAVLAESNYPLAKEGGSYVVYPEVRTIESGNGWTDRIFTFSPDVAISDFPYTPPVDNSTGRGMLKQEKIYNNSGTLLKKTTTDYYSTGSQYSQSGLKFKAYWECLVVCQDQWHDHPWQPGISPSIAACNSFSVRGHARDISQTIDSTFTSFGVIVNKTQFEYDTLGFGRLVLRKVKRYLNGGDIKSTTYKYPFTNNNQLIFGLNSSEEAGKSMLNIRNRFLPVETVDSLKPASGSAVLLGGSKYIYSVIGIDVFLTKVRTYTSMTDSVEMNFSQYDDGKNLAERYRTNDVKEAYLWGYNYLYPVAKVTGSSYAAISALVTNSILQNPSSDAALRTELNKIRTGLAGGMAQVTTYTYKKGVGMTSETDPTGKTIYYEYDNHGRLTLIRDQGNNILKKIEYKMVNPQ